MRTLWSGGAPSGLAVSFASLLPVLYSVQMSKPTEGWNSKRQAVGLCQQLQCAD